MKSLNVLLSLVLVTTLAACGKDGPGSTNPLVGKWELTATSCGNDPRSSVPSGISLVELSDGVATYEIFQGSDCDVIEVLELSHDASTLSFKSRKEAKLGKVSSGCAALGLADDAAVAATYPFSPISSKYVLTGNELDVIDSTTPCPKADGTNDYPHMIYTRK